MPRINLLPWREAAAQAQAPGVLPRRSAPRSRTAALVTLLGRWRDERGDRAPERAQPAAHADEIAALDKQIEEINGLENQKRRLIARMEIIETLQRSRPEIVHVFDELVRVLPEGVYLTYLKQSGTRIEMRGVAQSSTRVSDVHAQHRQLRSGSSDPSLQIVETQGRDADARRASSRCSRSSAASVPVEGDDAASEKVAAK